MPLAGDEVAAAARTRTDHDGRALAPRPMPLRARVLLDARQRAAKRPRAAPCASVAPPKRRRNVPASRADALSLDSLIVSNVLQAKSRVPRGFVRAGRTNVIDARLREIVVDWLMEVAAEYAAPSTTLALAVNYLDRMLACCSVTRHSVQPVAVVCMLLACKMDHSDPPSMLDGVAMCDRSADTAMLLATETTILLRLNFDLNVFTPCSVLPVLIHHVLPTELLETAEKLSSVLAHVAMLHAQLATRSPATIALACVVLSMHALGAPFPPSILRSQPDVRRALCSPMVLDSAVLLWQKWLTLHDASPQCPSRWVLKRWPEINPTAYSSEEPMSPASLRDHLKCAMHVGDPAPTWMPPSPLTSVTPTPTPRRTRSVATATPSSHTPSSHTPSSRTTATERDADVEVTRQTCLLSSSPLLDEEEESL